MSKPHKYTEEQIRFLKKYYKGRSLADVTKRFNRYFRLSLSSGSIKGAALKRGIISGYKPKTSWNKKYLAEHIRFLKKYVPGRHYSEVVDLFNKRFDFSVTAMQLASRCKKFGIKTGFTGRFYKGQVAYNKGIKGCPPGCEKGWFKKGQRPINWQPVGTERDICGYIEVKVSNRRKPPRKNWVLKQRHIWEKKKKKIPKNHVIVFADGNTRNFELDNLILISRNELAVMNKNGLIYNNKELTAIGKVIADLKIATSKQKSMLKRRK
jgi:hypothetical protein